MLRFLNHKNFILVNEFSTAPKKFQTVQPILIQSFLASVTQCAMFDVLKYLTVKKYIYNFAFMTATMQSASLIHSC